MKDTIAVHWFRQDLRLSDNPGLLKAASHGKVLPIYIQDNSNPKDYEDGAASRWWLNNSLISLKKSLGGNLSFYQGNPIDVLIDIANRFNVIAIYWNRCYESWRIDRDALIKLDLKKRGITSASFNSTLLWEPWNIKKSDGTPYKVFTPFYRKGCLQNEEPREPLQIPSNVKYIIDHKKTFELSKFNLLPEIRWDKKLEPHWSIGEEGAFKSFLSFIDKGLSNYKEGRNFPSKPYISKLSPHLHFGEISPNQIWHRIRDIGDNKNIEHFCSELGWREFSYNLLYNNPDLPIKNLQSKFDDFPWSKNLDHLSAWKKGKTGIPMVDAGMRELWQTGYMHNRLRMIVGSFLVKNLRLHWHYGERWFWNTLVDADLANNSAGWQWIAGCGADAAPYFRIFNPVSQGQKFDPNGEYIRRYIPEIISLPDKYLFCPWEAPDHILSDCGIALGKTYPNPIVDLKISRNEAMLAFKSLKKY